MSRGVLSAAAVLAAVSALATPAQAAFPGTNGKIAFRHGSGDAGSIETIQASGMGRDVVRETGFDPAWSADGTKLAFIDSTDPFARRLHTMAADGSGPVQITSTIGDYTESNPSWSPDRTQIAFEESGCPSFCYSGIVLVDADGSNRAFLEIFGSPVSGFEPAWSPDGSLIAFGSTVAGSDSDIYVTEPPDGSVQGYFPLTDDPASDTEPNWSPDGQKVVFHRASGPNAGIYVVNADGTGEAQLTDDGFQPVWSPDGSRIAFGSLRDGNAELYTIRADGTGLTNVTNSASDEDDPDWQPIPYGYARPKSATKTTLRFVPAYEACATPNASHGPPLATSSCNPPVPESDFLTVGTPDSTGAAANSAGSAVLRTICNPPAPGPVPPCSDAGDQADEEFQVSITDVRQSVSLLDYTGELETRVTIRMTDRFNGYCEGCSAPATVTDVPISFPVACAITLDAAVGSTCSVTTTADAVLPGLAREGKRSVWQLDSFELYDGGPDGDADTVSGNTLFAVQGLFTP